MILKTKRKVIERFSNGDGDKLPTRPINAISTTFNNPESPAQLSMPTGFKAMSDSDIAKAQKNIHKVTGSHDTNLSLWWREKSKLQKTGIIVTSLAVIGLVGWGVTKVIK